MNCDIIIRELIENNTITTSNLKKIIKLYLEEEDPMSKIILAKINDEVKIINNEEKTIKSLQGSKQILGHFINENSRKLKFNVL